MTFAKTTVAPAKQIQRTSWPDANSFAQELYAIFNAGIPVEISDYSDVDKRYARLGSANAFTAANSFGANVTVNAESILSGRVTVTLPSGFAGNGLAVDYAGNANAVNVNHTGPTGFGLVVTANNGNGASIAGNVTLTGTSNLTVGRDAAIGRHVTIAGNCTVTGSLNGKATSAFTADTATSATSATNATNATNATTATRANQLRVDGVYKQVTNTTLLLLTSTNGGNPVSLSDIVSIGVQVLQQV